MVVTDVYVIPKAISSNVNQLNSYFSHTCQNILKGKVRVYQLETAILGSRIPRS